MRGIEKKSEREKSKRMESIEGESGRKRVRRDRRKRTGGNE